MTETEVRTGEIVAAAQETNAQQDDVAALRERAEKAERESALRRAISGVDWFEPEDALRELAASAERDEGGGFSVASGNGRVSLDEAARELAARKPHWVRARVSGGSGANGGAGSAAGAVAALSYADLLRPENAERLREYVHNRPRELERMREAHFK